MSTDILDIALRSSAMVLGEALLENLAGPLPAQIQMTWRWYPVGGLTVRAEVIRIIERTFTPVAQIDGTIADD